MSHAKWKYHASNAAVVVRSEAEEKSLGPEWADSPAKFGVITCPSQDQIGKGISYREYMERWVSKEEKAQVKAEAKVEVADEAPKEKKSKKQKA